MQFAQNEKDIALFPLLVQYGRYLTIAASRPGSQAMNLQGIWSRNLRAVWSSNYTMNINTQMNYWPTLACALPELQEPLTVLVRDISKAGRDTAKELYGCKGWVSHHNTDLWRMTIPAGGAWKRREGFSAVRHSMWPMSGAWVCRHLYDQYEYTQDLAFLRDTAYDILKGSAEFALDWLVELPDGTLGTLPSTSPENEFVVDGEPYAASISSTMDISILRELFENCLACIETLSVNDAVFETRLRTALERLPQIRAASDGRIAEWSREYDENEVNHRHVSHLYGLYPADIMPEALKPACRLSLEKRGDEGTGWSLAWKTCLWARLQDADAAYRLLKRQLKPTQGKTVEYTNGGIYNNLLMAHPPFQIDANFGITAAILEMLVQCRNGCVFLLAALPRAWPTGKIEGVAIKGGAKISMHWRDGVLETLCVSM
ncbi:MAG: glycoside hydrolase family 95 protein, partial [Ruthenibacterium sp.]